MMLQLNDLAFDYSGADFRLQVPKLSLHEGQSVALVGPSGSGKTTLLNLISGILLPRLGTVRLGEHCISALKGAERRQFRLQHIGMIFQSFELLDYLDVRDNVMLQARLCQQVRVDRDLEQRARDVTEQLGLGDKWQRNIRDLSQGERQRVAACRALLLDPPLVLADEPTGNLDPDNKQAVLKQLIEECRQGERILLTVTHDHSLLPFFDRVIDMADLPASRATAS